MSRPKRIQFQGACYYITLQGNNRQDIFLGNQDRRFFLALLKAFKERHGLKVYAYCLMNSEAHVLLETSRPDLSRVMQGFCTAYTKYFNRLHRTAGHVFQGRYKALIVDKEHCLLDVTCRVHLTPHALGIKEKPWRYLWSSCAAYVESETSEPLVDSGPVLSLFAKNRLTQSVKYLHFIQAKMKEHGRVPLPLPIRGGVVGSAEFRGSIAQAPAASEDAMPAREKARKILEETVASRGVGEENLMGKARWGAVATARREAIHRMWKEARMGVTEIARIFHRTPSAVSQLIQSVEKKGSLN